MYWNIIILEYVISNLKAQVKFEYFLAIGVGEDRKSDGRHTCWTQRKRTFLNIIFLTNCLHNAWTDNNEMFRVGGYWSGKEKNTFGLKNGRFNVSSHFRLVSGSSQKRWLSFRHCFPDEIPINKYVMLSKCRTWAERQYQFSENFALMFC